MRATLYISKSMGEKGQELPGNEALTRFIDISLQS